MVSEFHWRDNIYFRATNDGVDVFRRPKRAAYWTPDKGFHDPEEPLFSIDRASWESIVSFIGSAHTALASTPTARIEESGLLTAINEARMHLSDLTGRGLGSVDSADRVLAEVLRSRLMKGE